MEDFVTFEQAAELKKFGFDWKCYTFYHWDNWSGLSHSGICENHNMFEKCVSAPTLSQAQKWLREVKDIIIAIEFDSWYEKYVCHVYKKVIYNSENIKDSYGSMLVTKESNEDFDNYEEALLEGIYKALEIL